MTLNTIDLTCVEQCPADISVAVPDPVLGEKCVPCDQKCVTCSGKPDFCTACQANLSLQSDTGICKLECDESNLTQVSVNGRCVGCSASCLTCQNTQDNCLSCVPGKYLYAYQCIDECPFLDGY